MVIIDVPIIVSEMLVLDAIAPQRALPPAIPPKNVRMKMEITRPLTHEGIIDCMDVLNVERVTSQDMPPITIAVEIKMKFFETASTNNIIAKNSFDTAVKRFIEHLFRIFGNMIAPISPPMPKKPRRMP
jgi:hypothetical protein